MKTYEDLEKCNGCNSVICPECGFHGMTIKVHAIGRLSPEEAVLPFSCVKCMRITKIVEPCNADITLDTIKAHISALLLASKHKKFMQDANLN